MSTKWRTVRVFISSTFRDMHAERDYLVKVVFPALRERLEQYRVHLIDIDLRWGVTREQAENDRVLDLCLRQIDECRPFFVCILGERYGHEVQRFPTEALRRYGWIQRHTGKSITELEIIHAIFNNPQMRGHAFFYFRDPAVLHKVPQSRREEVFEDTDPVLQDKLRTLKEAIRRSGYPVMDPYPAEWSLKVYDRPSRSYGRLAGLERFGDQVYQQLWKAIQAELHLPDTPPTVTLTETDPLAEEADYHQRFVELRLRVYVGRRRIHDKLMTYLESDSTSPLLLTGSSGSGKSAIMSRLWQARWDQHSDEFVLGHFVGASAESSDLRLILRRFCLELRKRFNLTEVVKSEDGQAEQKQRRVPEDILALPQAFKEMLELTPQDCCVVFIIDGIDHIQESRGVDILDCIPNTLPANVKIVLSCADPATNHPSLLTRLRARQTIMEHQVEPLTVWEAARIVRDVPSVSAKTLDAHQRRMLIENPASANPLFLTVALEELRGFGSYEQLNDKIASLPRAGDTVVGMFRQVIGRLSEDFDEHAVSHILSYLGVSRSGLSEPELHSLLEQEGVTGRDDLYPILRQMRPYLLHRGELVYFYHQAFHTAVMQHYLEDVSCREEAHRGLAMLFNTRADPSGDATFTGPARAMTELPYHLDGSGEQPWAIQRLLELPHTSFTAQKVVRTHDVGATSQDYGYFIKACLRQQDLAKSLQLARARAGLAQLAELVASPHVGMLAPLLSPDSPLWLQAQRAIMDLPSADERVERLTAFVSPGLAPDLWEWIQAQFRRDADVAREGVRLEFLCALARSRDGVLEYILSFLESSGISVELATALVERFQALHGTDSIEAPMETLASMAT